MIGVIDILRDDASVGARVGGTGTDARVYPMKRPQQSALPAVTVGVDDVEPTDTKDGVSTLDTLYVRVTAYATTYDVCRQLADECRTALDRTSGTYNTEDIDSIQFLDRFTDYEEIANVSIYFIEDNYKVRVRV